MLPSANDLSASRAREDCFEECCLVTDGPNAGGAATAATTATAAGHDAAGPPGHRHTEVRFTKRCILVGYEIDMKLLLNI